MNVNSVLSHRDAYSETLNLFDISQVSIVRTCAELVEAGVTDKAPNASQLSRWLTGSAANIETDTLRAFELALPEDARLFYYTKLAVTSRVDTNKAAILKELSEIQRKLVSGSFISIS